MGEVEIEWDSIKPIGFPNITPEFEEKSSC